MARRRPGDAGLPLAAVARACCRDTGTVRMRVAGGDPKESDARVALALYAKHSPALYSAHAVEFTIHLGPRCLGFGPTGTPAQGFPAKSAALRPLSTSRTDLAAKSTPAAGRPARSTRFQAHRNNRQAQGGDQRRIWFGNRRD